MEFSHLCGNIYPISSSPFPISIWLIDDDFMIITIFLLISKRLQIHDKEGRPLIPKEVGKRLPNTE